MKDLFAALVIVVMFVAMIAFGLWVTFFASCNQISWMPTKEIPNRCLQVRLR